MVHGAVHCAVHRAVHRPIRSVQTRTRHADCPRPSCPATQEILAAMEEMGLLKHLRTERVTFCSDMFVKFHANDDGVLRRHPPLPALPALHATLRPPQRTALHPQPPQQQLPQQRLPPYRPTPRPAPASSFDEFKGFYNAAIDDARGRKRAPKTQVSPCVPRVCTCSPAHLLAYVHAHMLTNRLAHLLTCSY